MREGESIETKGQVGRRNICLELGDHGAFVLAIALTANVKSVSISNSRGDIIGHRVLEELSLNDPKLVIKQVCEAAEALLKTCTIERSRLVGCGVSVAGVVDPETGFLVTSEPLGWKNVELGTAFSAALDIPVRVERRPVALLTAEMWRGAARRLDNIVLINNGLWLGGCVVADGRVLTGPANSVGQIAHMVVGGDDTLCSCGRRGCLDATASGISILRKLKHLNVAGSTADDEPGDRLRSLARYTGIDHPEVQAAFRGAGCQMGRAVDCLFALLQPELILLAGETSRHPAFLAGVHETLAASRPGEAEWPVKVSNITSDLSAVWVALDAFVFSHTLNIEKLKAA
ncbi:MAG: ROK family protein [Pseudomonadota bacterium]